jgi:hypothetical protein
MAKSSDNDKYWAKLIGQANVVLTGASDAELRVQLFDTLQEFFDHSNSWLEIVNFTVIPDTLDYKLMPMNGRILRLYGVSDQNGTPQQAAMPSIGTVHFLYPYTNAQPMTAYLVKTVTDPLKCYPPEIPEWVLPIYGHGILSGILGNMMLQPGQSYSNQTMANFHLLRFRDTIAHARMATMRGNTVGSQAWHYPQSFRVSGQKGGVSTYNVWPQQLR